MANGTKPAKHSFEHRLSRNIKDFGDPKRTEELLSYDLDGAMAAALDTIEKSAKQIIVENIQESLSENDEAKQHLKNAQNAGLETSQQQYRYDTTAEEILREKDKLDKLEAQHRARHTPEPMVKESEVARALAEAADRQKYGHLQSISDVSEQLKIPVKELLANIKAGNLRVDEVDDRRGITRESIAEFLTNAAKRRRDQ